MQYFVQKMAIHDEGGKFRQALESRGQASASNGCVTCPAAPPTRRPVNRAARKGKQRSVAVTPPSPLTSPSQLAHEQ